jgi:predicted MPP superfamily phosphohydrolase
MAARLAWVTDVHLNFVDSRGRTRFYETLKAASPDGLLLGGDVSESPLLGRELREMADAMRLPIYFVLGNHDYYHGSIAETRRRIAALAADVPLLHYLPEAGVVELAAHTALVGHGGWADAREGDFEHSDVMLNDYALIAELAPFNVNWSLDKPGLRAELNRLGDEAAGYLAGVLPDALASYGRVVVLTHVPPFREACWYRGQISDDDYLPHFSCRAVGEVLREAVKRHPDREMLVLCGHTHGAGEARILPNLLVLTGAAEYGKPALQRVFEFD